MKQYVFMYIMNMSLQLLRAKYPQMPCSQDLRSIL